jgi:hypothetical protein
MAYEFASASSQHLSTPAENTFTEPFTIACWFINKAASTGQNSLVSVNSSTTGDRVNLVALATNALRFSLTDSGGNTLTDTATGLIVRDTWSHAAGVVSSTTSRSVILNGANKVTTSVTRAPNVDSLSIGASELTGTYLQFLNGFIAEVGIWNAALTDAEVASLAKGATCNLIRPQSLVFYAPLIRDLQDVRGGLTITNNNGATVANHPRVYR